MMEVISVIKLSSLTPWHSESDNDSMNVDCDQQRFKFDVSPNLNKKVYLCQGGISQLELDCVVLPVNEITLTDSPLSKEVFQTAGGLLPDFYHNLKDVKTGNVVLGSGFDLPSRFIIHAMEPGMNAKFKSAVENAVHRCYRNAMELARENNLKTIGFVSLYENLTVSLNEEMAHTALGTVRSYLEKHQHGFEAFVFCVKNSDLDVYLKLLPAYFPRTSREAAEVSNLLAFRNLGEWGERVDEDRAIRISHIPLSKTAPLSSIDENVPLSNDEVMSSDVVGKPSFSSMDGDHDVTRLRRIKSMDDARIENTKQRIYRRLLCLAHSDNLHEISSTNSLYLSGLDRDGDTVVVVVANRIKIDQKNADKALLYFIRTLDTVVNKPYSLVYFHTMTQPQNHPSLSFIKRVFNVLDNRYKDNLKRLFMVHPTITNRVLTWFFATFSRNALKSRILTVKNIPQLYEHIAPDQIEIPPFVSDYDLTINHEIYKSKLRSSEENSNNDDML